MAPTLEKRIDTLEDLAKNKDAVWLIHEGISMYNLLKVKYEMDILKESYMLSI